MRRIVPTLSCLTRHVQPGRDPLAWKHWMKQRALGPERVPARDTLDLPIRR